MYDAVTAEAPIAMAARLLMRLLDAVALVWRHLLIGARVRRERGNMLVVESMTKEQNE